MLQLAIDPVLHLLPTAAADLTTLAAVAPAGAVAAVVLAAAVTLVIASLRRKDAD